MVLPGFIKIVEIVQTFVEAERHHWKSMEREWDKEKEKILNSLLGTTQELEFPTEAEVHMYIIIICSSTMWND